MNDVTIKLLIQILSSGVTNLLMFLLFYKLYKPKYRSKVIYVVAFVCTTVCIILVNRLFMIINIAYFNSLFLFMYASMLSFFMFKAKANKTFIYNAIYIIISVFVDIGSVLLCSIVTGKDFETISHEIKYIMMFNSFYCLIMVIVWAIFISIVIKNHLESIKLKQICLIALFVLFALFVEYNFTIRINSMEDVIIDLLVLIGFLIAAIYVVYFTNEIARAYKERYEYALMKNQNELQLEHYMEINKKYEKSRVIIHDIKKHLEVLNSLNDFNNEQAKEYGSIIEKEVDLLFGGFQCSNKILSIIMSQKIAAAENEMIKVNTKVEDILFDFVDDLDMTAMFANLWDNAIEASVKVEPSERFINVIIGRVNDFIVISFENSFNGIIKKKSEHLLSTKKEHEGVGVSIIKSSIEKYSGTITMRHTENIFKVEALIPVS